MAQIGCYVPAEAATFRSADRIFARIYLEDNMQYGASAFILEVGTFKNSRFSDRNNLVKQFFEKNG